MSKIKPTIFRITKEEVEEVFEEKFDLYVKLTERQIQLILDCVEGDEMLAKDIRNSIIGSINEVLH
mgnify:CR=1 FL=1